MVRKFLWALFAVLFSMNANAQFSQLLESVKGQVVNSAQNQISQGARSATNEAIQAAQSRTGKIVESVRRPHRRRCRRRHRRSIARRTRNVKPKVMYLMQLCFSACCIKCLAQMNIQPADSFERVFLSGGNSGRMSHVADQGCHAASS